MSANKQPNQRKQTNKQASKQTNKQTNKDIRKWKNRQNDKGSSASNWLIKAQLTSKRNGGNEYAEWMNLRIKTGKTIDKLKYIET